MENVSVEERFTFFNIKAGIICGILYCIPMFFVLFHADFRNVWVLYVGSSIFLFSTLFSVIIENRKRRGNVTIGELVKGGMIRVVIGILTIFIITIATIIIAFPHLIGTPPNTTQLTDTPVNMIEGETNGLVYVLFMNGAFVNLAAGAFGAFIGSLCAKRLKSNMGDDVDVEVSNKSRIQ